MNLKLKSLSVLVTLFLSSLAAGQAPVAQPKDGDLKFEPFTIPFEGQNVEAELGRLAVRENRSHPKTKLIGLAFVRLKSTAEKPGYPVVYLDGGPGSSAINIARAPDYMRAFMKLREAGDVILLDQRGIGRSRPNLSRLSNENLPLDSFADTDSLLRAFRARVVDAATHFRNEGVDIQAYNTIESAHDVDDLRKALGVEKLNLVGFSYGTHLGLACIRYHGPNLNRVVLIGTEGPDHTNKLPSTSDTSLKRLARLAAAAPELSGKIPDLGDQFRSPIRTNVATLSISGTLDNNTPPFQADDVRKTFKTSTHLVIENAGHESMLVDPRIQQTMVEYLRGGDVSKTKIALPPLKFNELPKSRS